MSERLSALKSYLDVVLRHHRLSMSSPQGAVDDELLAAQLRQAERDALQVGYSQEELQLYKIRRIEQLEEERFG
ncbi:hypothetical protein A2961_00315 [Candidatus Woesebacteria bacterium RIFCSPLOWO2_01_FULL_39_21]|uniref:Uncharacterized protein n=1 Tax=Candidatus Woesebacteria bacterium RIFCSPLOWO2_01_FULL_39_21 TaxID=1802519 RepID=A0A1F8BHT5_9BACT|nr:MAG: hypothetical protein A2961_00315 [Candidatus Woesebacteria bacterium RIFCSPLOWO2_01_FULL_39_21]